MAGPNARTRARFEEAAFILRFLTGDGKPANPGLKGVVQGELRLPIPPQQVEYDDQARVQVYAKVGGQNGADQHGASPPVVTISGTTAQGQRGGMDGYEWQQALEDAIAWYLRQVEAAGRARRPLHVLEWHDLLNDQHWVVVPLKTPYGRRDSGSPLRAGYQLRLQGLRRTTDPEMVTDPISAALDNPETCPFAPGCAQAGQPFAPGCKYRGVTT